MSREQKNRKPLTKKQKAALAKKRRRNKMILFASFDSFLLVKPVLSIAGIMPRFLQFNVVKRKRNYSVRYFA